MQSRPGAIAASSSQGSNCASTGAIRSVVGIAVPEHAVEVVVEVRCEEVLGVVTLAADDRVREVRTSVDAQPTDVVEVEVREQHVGDVGRRDAQGGEVGTERARPEVRLHDRAQHAPRRLGIGVAVRCRPAQQRRIRLVDGGHERLAVAGTGPGVDEHDALTGADDEAADVEEPSTTAEILGVHGKGGVVLSGESGWLGDRHAAVEHGPDLDVADANERRRRHGRHDASPKSRRAFFAEDRVLLDVGELVRRPHDVDRGGLVVGLRGAVAVRAEQQTVDAGFGDEPGEQARVRRHRRGVEPQVCVMGRESCHPARLVVAREGVERERRHVAVRLGEVLEPPW